MKCAGNGWSRSRYPPVIQVSIYITVPDPKIKMRRGGRKLSMKIAAGGAWAPERSPNPVSLPLRRAKTYFALAGPAPCPGNRGGHLRPFLIDLAKYYCIELGAASPPWRRKVKLWLT